MRSGSADDKSANLRIEETPIHKGSLHRGLVLRSRGSSRREFSPHSARTETELLHEMGQRLHGRLTPQFLRIPIREE